MYIPSAALLLLLLSTLTSAADSSKNPPKPCTLHSPTSGSYFDLTPISLEPPEKDAKTRKKSHKDAREESWHAKGYDYPANFTINFCAPVIEDLAEMGGVEGVDKKLWANVSAYYEYKGEIYSIGQHSSEPLFRGRKLVLNYTDGSPCPDDPSDLTRRKVLNDDDDDEDDDEKDREDDDDDAPPKKKPKKKPSSSKPAPRRKSTLLSFLCDRDALSGPATISFVGTPDSCSYFFEVRSRFACGGSTPENAAGTVGPAGVFGIIAAIAVVAYLVGGCAYQRSVMHQRGWRQCPNYGMWAGLLGLIGDFCIILTSSLGRVISGLRNHGGGGYSRVPADGAANAGRGGLGRGRTADDENRLIDSLDEEWD